MIGIRRATQYPANLFASAPQIAAPQKQAWPVLPPLSFTPAKAGATAGCSRAIPTRDNAGAIVERGIGLREALKDGAFGSTSDLERFIDGYIAHSAARSERRALHEGAIRDGVEFLANRIDADERDLERAVEQQRMTDRLALMQLRAQLPIQQRTAVGEVAISIARAVTFVGKFVPVAGDLIVLAEVATGRDLPAWERSSIASSAPSRRFSRFSWRPTLQGRSGRERVQAQSWFACRARRDAASTSVARSVEAPSRRRNTEPRCVKP